MVQLRTELLRASRRTLAAWRRRLGDWSESASLVLRWLVPLASLEVLGRVSPFDATDAVGVAGIWILAFTRRDTWRRALERLRATRGGGRVARLLARWRPIVGVDLRSEPALPRALPHSLSVPFVAIVVVTAILVPSHAAFPTDARDVLGSVSGLVALLWTTLVWSACLAGAFFLASSVLVHLRYRLEASSIDRRRRRALRAGGAAYLLGCLLLGAVAPPRAALIVLVLALALLACVALLPSLQRLRVAWAQRERPETLFSFSFGTGLVVTASFLTCAIVVVFLLAAGDRLDGELAPESAITSTLGRTFLWVATGAAAYVFAFQAVELFVNRASDPARPAPVQVRLANVPEHDAARVRQAFEARGFRVAGGAHDPTDVPVVWSSAPLARELRAGEDGSVALSASGLADERTVERLRRRAAIRRRRLLVRRLERLFKIAAGRRYLRGAGFWVAPHLWFITHLSRDDDDDDMWLVGPSYRSFFPRAARHHLYETLRALEIDLLFVEDGVGFRRFKRVLAMLFEYHDMFGERPIEERHFAGLPGVRVVVHEHPGERHLRPKFWKEPDYEGVGRARILHVARDRPDDVESFERPFDTDWAPAPAAPELSLV